MSQWLVNLREGLRAHEDERGDLEASRAWERFSVVREIGRGGMGTVLEAQDTELGRRVALKFLHGSSLSMLERFRVETETLARLSHPHVVTLHEVGHAEGAVFLVMDLVDGESLDKTLEEGPLEPVEAARIAREVASALAHCHERGVLHRDVKPSNILLDAAGRALLTDFGVAKDLGASLGLTQTGVMVGTLAYMAPEQACGEHDRVDARSDVYALGATLFELLTGGPPRIATAGSGSSLEREPERPSALCPKIDADLDAICLKCLQPDPSDRYASASALEDDLGRYLLGEPVAARAPSWLARVARLPGRRPALATALVGSGALATLLTLAAVAELTSVDPRTPLRVSPSDVRGDPAQDPLGEERVGSEPTRFSIAGLGGACFAGSKQILAWGSAGWELWDVGGESPTISTEQAEMRCAVASVDGDRLLIGAARGVSLYGVTSRGTLDEITVPNRADAIALAPDGALAVVAAAQSVLLWRPLSREAPRLVQHVGTELRAVAFSPDGRLFAASCGGTNSSDGASRELFVWSATDCALVARWKLPLAPFQLAFAPGTGLLACGDDWGSVLVFDPAVAAKPPIRVVARQETFALAGAHVGPVGGLVFAAGGRTLYSVSRLAPLRAFRTPNVLRRWTVEPGSVRLDGTFRELPGDRYVAVDLSPDGASLLLATSQAEEVTVLGAGTLR